MSDPGERVVKVDQCWRQGHGASLPAWFVESLAQGRQPVPSAEELRSGVVHGVENGVATLVRWVDTGEGFDRRERQVPVQSLLSGDGGWHEVDDPDEVERLRVSMGVDVRPRVRAEDPEVQRVVQRVMDGLPRAHHAAVLRASVKASAHAMVTGRAATLADLEQALRDEGVELPSAAAPGVGTAFSATGTPSTPVSPQSVERPFHGGYPVPQVRPVVEEAVGVGVTAVCDQCGDTVPCPTGRVMPGGTCGHPDYVPGPSDGPGVKLPGLPVIPVPSSGDVDPTVRLHGEPLPEAIPLHAALPSRLGGREAPSVHQPGQRWHDEHGSWPRMPMTVSYGYDPEHEDELVEAVVSARGRNVLPTVHGAPDSFYERVQARYDLEAQQAEEPLDVMLQRLRDGYPQMRSLVSELAALGGLLGEAERELSRLRAMPSFAAWRCEQCGHLVTHSWARSIIPRAMGPDLAVENDVRLIVRNGQLAYLECERGGDHGPMRRVVCRVTTETPTTEVQ